jgi:hypothetical protein
LTRYGTVSNHGPPRAALSFETRLRRSSG